MDDENPLANYQPFNELDNESPVAAQPALSPTIGADAEEEEIRAMEQRVNILQAQVTAQENQFAHARETGSFEPPPNWPKFYPLIHFDIEEVPQSLRKFVTEGIFGWCLMDIAFTLNFIGCLSLLRAGEVTDSPGSKVALSALYLFLLVPLSLDLNALAVYRVLKSDSPSSLSYMKLFVFLGITTAFQCVLTFGLESSGSCGLITMINLFVSGHWFIGVIALLVTLALGMSTFVHFQLLRGLWSYYRGTEQGGNIEQDMKRTLAVMVVDALK